MAISKLVSGERTQRTVNLRSSQNNTRIQKVSSSMFAGDPLAAVSELLRGFTEQIINIHETAKKILESFIKLGNSVKQMNKDITQRFRVLNKDLNANNLDFVRSVLTPIKVEDRTVGASKEAEKTEEKKEAKKDDTQSSFVDTLMTLIGLRAGAQTAGGVMRGLVGFMASPAGLLVSSFAAITGATVAAIFGTAAVGDYFDKKFDIGKKLAEKAASPEGQELTRTQQEAADRKNDRANADRQKKIAENVPKIMKEYGLTSPSKDIRMIPENPDIMEIIKEGPHKGKKFNIITGEQVTGEVQRRETRSEQTAPPAPAGTPTTTTAPAAAGGTNAAGGAAATTTGTPSGAAKPPVQALPSAPAGSQAQETPSGSKGGAGVGAPIPQRPQREGAGAATGAAVTTAETAPIPQRPQREGAPAAAPPIPQRPPGREGSPNAAAASNVQPEPMPTAPPPPMPVPVVRESKQPVVLNNNQSSSSSSTSGPNNFVTGQNFPMTAHNQYLQEFIARQNIQYA